MVSPWLQDSASIAAMSRDKLIERQEKLQVPWNFINVSVNLALSASKGWVGHSPSMQGISKFDSHFNTICTNGWSTVIIQFAYDLRLLMVNVQAINKQSEELQDGAGNFASLAEELAKKIENRKWYEF